MPTVGQIFFGIGLVVGVVTGLYWTSRLLEWLHERQIAEDRREAQKRWDNYAAYTARRAEQIRQQESNVVPIRPAARETNPFATLPAGLFQQPSDAQPTTSSD